MQLLQANGLVDPVLGLYVPTPHSVQTVEPAADQVPAAHAWQTAALVPPVVLPNEPAAQSTHASESAPAHWPAGQMPHSVEMPYR